MQLTHQEGLANYVEINHDIQKQPQILIAFKKSSQASFAFYPDDSARPETRVVRASDRGKYSAWWVAVGSWPGGESP